MSNPVSLGIDLGTSELKAILMDLDGSVLAHAGVRLSVSRRNSGWSEQDPQDWWQACLQALAQLRRCIRRQARTRRAPFDQPWHLFAGQARGLHHGRKPFAVRHIQP